MRANDPAARQEKRRANQEARSRELTTITIEPRRPGRPTQYTPELGEAVCERMIEAGGLAAACRQYEELPDRVTVYRWMSRNPDFERELFRARERLIERMVDEMLDLADDDRLEPNDRRIRIETRRWIAGKWNAKRYGDKVQIGGDPDNPIQVLHKTVALDALSSAELDALDAFTSARLAATDVEEDEVVDVAGVSPDAQG